MAVAVMMLRLDKYLADMGKGTRKEIKKKIQKGLVLVDGKVVKEPERKVDPDAQEVSLEGKVVAYAVFSYLMLNKPAGVVSATQDSKEKTVLDLIKGEKRKDLFPVGRLDKDTVGLLLLTNDGELAHRLLSPAKHVDKVYFARVKGLVDKQDVELFATGVDIGDEKPCLPAELTVKRLDPESGESEVEICIREGRFHQVKRMFQAVGKEVLFLKRLKMGELCLDECLNPGEYRELTEEEKEKLCCRI